jgi:hypothetical protein
VAKGKQALSVKALRFVMAISDRPSPQVTDAVFAALEPSLPTNVTFKVYGNHVVAFMGNGA